ncbi:MAG: hypothetical protein ACI8XG_001745, partial [Congregibacter sp.]
KEYKVYGLMIHRDLLRNCNKFVMKCCEAILKSKSMGQGG